MTSTSASPDTTTSAAHPYSLGLRLMNAAINGGSASVVEPADVLLSLVVIIQALIPGYTKGEELAANAPERVRVLADCHAKLKAILVRFCNTEDGGVVGRLLADTARAGLYRRVHQVLMRSGAVLREASYVLPSADAFADVQEMDESTILELLAKSRAAALNPVPATPGRP